MLIPACNVPELTSMIVNVPACPQGRISPVFQLWITIVSNSRFVYWGLFFGVSNEKFTAILPAIYNVYIYIYIYVYMYMYIYRYTYR